HRLREGGTTIILTTHYIEEAEEMADRVGVISGGRLLLVEDKTALMRKMGKRELDLVLVDPLATVPAELDAWRVQLLHEGRTLRYVFDATEQRTSIPSLLRRPGELRLACKDRGASKSSLEATSVALVDGG